MAIAREHAKEAEPVNKSMGTGQIAAWMLLVVLTGCGASGVPRSDGFDYERKNHDVMCGGRKVTAVQILEKIQSSIPNALAEKGKEDLLDYLDFTKPDLIGSSLYESVPRVVFLFVTVIKENAKLAGEGGVAIIIDPCQADIVDLYQFHMN